MHNCDRMKHEMKYDEMKYQFDGQFFSLLTSYFCHILQLASVTLLVPSTANAIAKQANANVDLALLVIVAICATRKQLA